MSWDAQILNCSGNASVHSQDWFRRLDSRFQQFVLRNHCRYFLMRINHPEKCERGHVHLLIVVKSVKEQHDQREAMRLTLGVGLALTAPAVSQQQHGATGAEGDPETERMEQESQELKT